VKKNAIIIIILLLAVIYSFRERHFHVNLSKIIMRRKRKRVKIKQTRGGHIVSFICLITINFFTYLITLLIILSKKNCNQI
jgi:hypothetical protein